MSNDPSLECLTNDTCEYSNQDAHDMDHCSVYIDLQHFVTFLSTAADILASDNPEWKEIKNFHDIQQRYNGTLCCNNCLIFLHRAGHCLKCMVLLNLSKSYLDLAENFLKGSQDISASLHLPSNQEVEYILIRTKAAAKLVSEVIIYSRNTFCFLIQKLKTQLVPELMVAACSTAKFNMMLKSILKQLCTIYKEVLAWRLKLSQGIFTQSEKIDLPEDLEKWLETFDSGLIKSFSISASDYKMLSSALNVKVGNDDSDLDCLIVIDEEEN